MLEKHKLLTVFNLYDPFQSRFNRASLLFLNVIGKMYFIGLFYEGEKTAASNVKGIAASYSLRDALVILWSSLIMLVANAFFIYFMKNRPVSPNMPREVFDKTIKFNSRKKLGIFIIFISVFAWLLWSIAMFALHLDKFTSYKWIINTSISIFIDMIVTPLVKGIVITMIGGWILKKIKEKIEKSKIESATVMPVEGELNIYTDDKKNKVF
jgi:hypothetical protein